MNEYETRSMISYNKKADRYEDTFDGRFTRSFKIQLVKKVVIPEGGKVLDVACGNGRLLQMFSQEQPLLGYGTDISEKMVENARRLNPDMVFKTAGCASLPFEDDFFDVVTVCAAFHHFPDVEGFAQEVFRVLKPQGMVYVAEVYVPAWVRVLCNPLMRFSQDGDVKFYAPEEIQRLFENTGLKNELFWKEGKIQIVGARK